MKMIVGLGNPGKDYENTRHNVGFMFIDFLASRYNLNITKKKFDGLFEIFEVSGEKILFLKPQSYINLSGEVIKKFLDFYKIDTSDLLIISDDLDMDFSKIKIKKSGSSGGHNGLKNVEMNLGTRDYKRIKIGISNDKMIDTKNYVLGKLSLEEKKLLDKTFLNLEKVIDDYLSFNFEKLMSKYNGICNE
ncbi:MAG: aminoacyl-tRNA hydrolase [Bacilli bacterium]|nr:aminoacyl-tRNA hydrolase [Bacilli bacterium]